MKENTRPRIAGPDHPLAKKYPDVSRFVQLSIDHKLLSRNVYGCIDLALRTIGFVPKTKDDIIEFERVLAIMNDHKAAPQLIVPAADDLRINVADNASAGNPVSWDDPDMEEEFF